MGKKFSRCIRQDTLGLRMNNMLATISCNGFRCGAAVGGGKLNWL